MPGRANKIRDTDLVMQRKKNRKPKTSGRHDPHANREAKLYEQPIAKQYYGKASKYQDIFKANSDILKNPDVIHPDQELIIPKL